MARRYVVNPTTGKLDAIDEFTGAGGDEYNVETFVLTNTDITNKSVTLAEPPTDNDKTQLDVIGGIPQAYGDDFTILGSTVSWDGLGLDGILSNGDKIIITYN